MNSLETPKQFSVKMDLFTIENELLTPTMKLKRNVARAQFKDEIERLYSLPALTIKK
jgi:long-chain acyl-CoA synthetase